MYLLDSNILINFLNGNGKEVEWINSKKNEELFVYISVISKIEVMSFSGLSEDKLPVIEKFLNLFQETPLDKDIISVASLLRRKFKIPLADSIITASAISRKKTLVTNDKILAKKVKDLVEVLSLS